MHLLRIASALLPCIPLLLVAAPRCDALDIVIAPGAGLVAHGQALDAFERAAARWERLFEDDVIVTIEADFTSDLPRNVVGNAESVRLSQPFDALRAALIADADADDAILGQLPAFADFGALVPGGFALDGEIESTKANLKALGLQGLDAVLGVADGSIAFNAASAFDFDSRDGVGAGLFDFESVAAHEIAHLLGFVSVVDSIDLRLATGAGGAVAPTPLDLFRFSRVGAPASAADFVEAPRNLLPGADALLTDLGALSELVSAGLFAGDGREASHWRDDRLLQPRREIGLLDPTLGFGRATQISPADTRALDLIGWDVVPEPSTGSLTLAGLAALAARRRRPLP